jgi:hypothetical protein
MAMITNVAKIEATNGPQGPKSIVTSVASANVQLLTNASAAVNPWNTTANQAGGARDLAARGLWMVSVTGSAVNVRFALTSGAAVAVATDPVWPIGWMPLPVAIPPGTWVAALGTGAGRVDFFRVDAFRD